MALIAEHDLVEHELRVEQMQTNIEKMRAEMRWETRKSAVQLFVAAAAGAGAMLAVLNFIGWRAH